MSLRGRSADLALVEATKDEVGSRSFIWLRGLYFYLATTPLIRAELLLAGVASRIECVQSGRLRESCI